MIYLDHAASAPLRREALEAMLPFLTEYHGNPSSACRAGTAARRGLNRARRQIAETLGARPEEILFTSGGTESDNLALMGAALAYRARGKHIITTEIEHPAVRNTCRRLERFGWEVTWLKAAPDGRVAPEAVCEAVRPDTVLVSVMYANNETGVIQPVEEIGRAAAEKGILFHTDAVQAYGHIPVQAGEADLIAASAHKFGGPKGIGFLYCRKGVALEPLLTGGGQEDGLRSGTEAPALAAGMGEAAGLACAERETAAERIRGLASGFREALHAAVPEAVVWQETLSGEAEVLPGFLTVSFPGLEAEALLISLDRQGICVSGGSACSSAERKPSHVLTAMGLPLRQIRGTLRVTIGMENTAEEMEEAVKALARAVRQAGSIR